MCLVLQQLISNGKFFSTPDDAGQSRWLYEDQELVVGDIKRECIVKAIGSILAFHLVWYGNGFVPVSMWVLHWMVVNAHTIQELDIEIDWRDPVAGKILSHWPEQRPSELSDEACTLCIDYLDMSVRLDLSASF